MKIARPWVYPIYPSACIGIMTVIYASYVTFDQRMGLIPGECSILQKVLPKHFFVQGSFTATYQPLLPNYVCQSPVLRNILCPHISPHIQFIGAATIPKELQVQVTTDSSSTQHATTTTSTRSASFGGTKTQAQIKAFCAADNDNDNDNTAATNSKGVVYMGWGSMISISSETMVVFAVETLRECQQRGIVLGGWANLNMQTLERATQDATIVDYARKNVLFIDTAPHEWLFPQCSCIVHHGGAGTTAAALRASVPTIITPVFVDQFDHAYAIEKLGVGVGFSKQLQKITPIELASAIRTVLSSPEIVQTAQEIGTIMLQENGAREAVTIIQHYWENTVRTGMFTKNVDRRYAEIQHWHRQQNRRRKTIMMACSAVGIGVLLAVAWTRHGRPLSLQARIYH